MSISFSGATGDLFNILSRLGKMASELRSYQNAQNTNMTSQASGVVGQLNAEPDIQAVMGDNYLSILAGAGNNIASTLQDIAARAVQRVVYRDNVLPGQTLTSGSTLSCLLEVIRQMKAQAQTVLAMTVAAAPSGVVAGVGNGVLVASAKRAADGLYLENAFAETVKFVCTADSYTGGRSAGNETFSMAGEGQESDVFGFDWPLGSGGQGSLFSADGNSDNSAGNVLTNSGYENWTSDVPDNWSLTTGTAGTHVFREGSLNYDGSYSMRVTGDGSTLVSLSQALNSSSGSLGVLNPLRQYAFNVWARRDGIAPGAGVWVVELIDGNGVVINDQAGTANSFEIDLTGLSTSYAAQNTVFRTPRVMPSSYSVRQRMKAGNALSSGRSVYFDKACLAEMSQLYLAGPAFRVFGGSVPFQLNDYTTCEVTNSRGSGGTLDTWQTLFTRLFPDMLGSGLLLPSSASPSISDSLITA